MSWLLKKEKKSGSLQTALNVSADRTGTPPDATVQLDAALLLNLGEKGEAVP